MHWRQIGISLIVKLLLLTAVLLRLLGEWNAPRLLAAASCPAPPFAESSQICSPAGGRLGSQKLQEAKNAETFDRLSAGDLRADARSSVKRKSDHTVDTASNLPDEGLPREGIAGKDPVEQSAPSRSCLLIHLLILSSEEQTGDGGRSRQQISC